MPLEVHQHPLLRSDLVVWYKPRGMNCGHDEVPDNATLHLIAFASKSLLIAECGHSNFKWEALSILHGLKVHHFFFAREYVIIDQKHLMTLFRREVATLSQQL